ncbi:MAG: hypothetical protein K0Q91_1461 [Fibrobacteria bacterium]|nr:hypothetical protein [Fibrobacteria bacterium]
MKKLTLLLALAGLVGVTQAQPFAAWTRYRTVTINTTVVSAPLTNYPVLVRFSSSSLAAGSNVLADAKVGGADVRFTDSTGNTALAYEIDSWTATSGAAWVRLPTVPASGSTKIRVYWGNSAATAASNPGAVFDSAGGFVGVWHLGNASGLSPRPNAITGAPAATPANDFAANSFGGGAASYVAPDGQIGGSDAVRGAGTRATPEAGSDYLDIGSPAGVGASNYVGVNTYTGYNDFSNGFTYSVWVKANVPQGNYSYLVELANANGCNDNIQVFRPAADARYRMEACNGTTSGGTAQTPNNTLVNGTWEFYTFTFGTGATPASMLYKNGVRVTNSNRTQPLSNVLRTNAWLGKSNYDVDYYFNGTFDESRISRVARDSNWIKMDFATQRSDSSAVGLGATVASKALFYPTKNMVILINDSTANNTPVTSGAATGWTINPTSLPTGLTFSSSTGVISGKPTAVTAATQFIVSATVGGNPASDTITIAVSAGTPPGAPTSVTGVRASRQVTLSWVAPVSSGTSAITGYKAVVVGDTAKTCSTTGALTCTITGLTNGTAYTFQVRASNGAGGGPLSAASAAITPAGRPGRPGSFTVTQIPSTNTATATWTAAADSGAAIQNYFIFTVPAGGACAATPPAVTCTVTGLAPGTAYSVRLYAFNAIGAGDTATASLTTTGIRGNNLLLRVAGMSKPFGFSLPMDMIATTEKVTLSISNIQGRTVWSKSLNPVVGQNEVTWNGKASNGTAASAGTYMVRVSLVDKQGKVTNVDRKTISIRP